ncbi:hypothetical protein Vadar_014372 [Vaccinium darrowii]|uniref:Uncharacterized protein n=1 Tax=Vaccinium darrowii TaxID=229202 RepID=A0ACB7XIM3_9ERIC|nr:hypothetical protein Vadar_014372 [Vaccinium darrowii]
MVKAKGQICSQILEKKRKFSSLELDSTTLSQNLMRRYIDGDRFSNLESSFLHGLGYVSSELATDVIIIVGEVKFYLHKFPLLSKSNRLRKLVLKAHEENFGEIYLDDFPDGPKAFEICVKFCYGMTVTLNAYNVVAARCAAEYLEMSEDVDRGNLIFKIEVFLNSDLKVIGRCVDSIASKTSVDPSSITWSYTYNRKLSVPDRIIENGMKIPERGDYVSKDWWIEDICELDIDQYKRVMIAVKSKGWMDGSVIGEALKTYVMRWLPDTIDSFASEFHPTRNKSLVETIICLLPSDKGLGCSCSFLLKLFKFAILVGVDETLREDLTRRISLKLDEASVNDLLIPARSSQATKYDVDLVQALVNGFMFHEKCCWEAKITGDSVLGCGSWMNVGKLIDGYLGEIAHDPNLSLSSFILLSQSIPESARPIHDGLYRAIDIYLKEHQNLTKAERKKICGLMDVKKLTMDASMHAAQNELLPLRVVVQVLYFEQVRAASGAQRRDDSNSITNAEEDWDKTLPNECNDSLGKQMSRLKSEDNKRWEWNGYGENRSSETSGSSPSPTSMIQGENKSSGSSS